MSLVQHISKDKADEINKKHGWPQMNIQQWVSCHHHPCPVITIDPQHHLYRLNQTSAVPIKHTVEYFGIDLCSISFGLRSKGKKNVWRQGIFFE
eukprot:376237_1